MTFPAKYWSIIALLLQTAYIILQVLALTLPSWAKVTAGDSVYHFSLTKCEDCPDSLQAYTPECITNIDCEVDSTAAICSIAQHLSRSRDMYYSGAVLSLIAAALVLTSCGYRCLGYMCTRGRMLYALLAIEVLGCLMSVVMWFGETKAGFSHGPIVAEIGPKLAIAALVAAAVAAGATYTSDVVPQERIEQVEIGSSLFLSLTLRQWMYVKVLPLVVVALSFDIWSLSSEWVRYNTTVSYGGSLFTIDTIQSFHDIAYGCVTSPACDIPGKTMFADRYCKAFPRLAQAETAFLGVDAISLLATMLWAENCIYYAAGVEFGIPLCNYIWPVLATVAKSIGICLWFAISKASFFAECELETTTDDINFCARDGAIFALWQLLCQSVACAFFLAFYWVRRRQMRAVHDEISQISAIDIAEKDLVSPNESMGFESFKSASSRPNSSWDQRTNFKTSTETSILQTMREVSGSECIACEQERDLDDIRFELPCGHWVHIACFAKIGSNRKNCPKCCTQRPHTQFL